MHVDGYIPEPFTENDGDKLSLYQDLKEIHTEKDLVAYEKKISDLFGKIPKEVQQIFEQRRLDLFANSEGVSSLKESEKQIIISMDETWSRQVDGMRLFEAMNGISRAIKMTYKNKEIQIFFDKKKQYLTTLNKVIKVLQDPVYRKTRD